jgi:HSP20 family protein
MLFHRLADPRSAAPFQALRSMQAELERLFTEPGPARSAPTTPFAVYHGPEGLLLRTPLPGVDASALTLEIDGSELTLSGRVSDVAGVENALAKHLERPRGAFRRSVRLPFEVDAEKVEARLERGVLEIRLPRIAKPAPVKIAVQSPAEPRSAS